MKRSRRYYALWFFATIALGLFSRTSVIPALIYPYLGDYLYALMFFFLAGLVFTTRESFTVAAISIIVCYLIELLQLYQADWINAIRSYKLGGLILGYGFLWSDMVSYTLGGLTGYGFERFFQKKPVTTPSN